MAYEKLDALFQAIGAASELLILPHNNPDPDAIASAVALRYLLMERLNIEAHIAYQGLIGRAENRALVRYLVHPLRPLTATDLSQDRPVAFVDTQPGAGNNVDLPPEANLVIVIDHHHVQMEGIAAVRFSDVRSDVGATSTILAEYFRTADLELPSPLATALFYGIKTNTMGLSRNAGLTDATAYYYLQPHIDVKGLTEIEHARVPSLYFKGFDAALRAARLYEHLLISYIGPLSYPDLPAEMADLLLRLEESFWVICLGTYGQDLILSIRTYQRQGNAAELVQAIVGAAGTAGGHGAIAGGQIPLAGQDLDMLVSQLIRRTLQYFNLAPDTPGKPLLE